MTITSVSVKKIEKESSQVKGFVTIVFDDMYAVHGIKIIEGENGLWVAMPSRKTPTGEYTDIAHPINAEARKMIEDAIFEEYNKTE